MRVSTRRLTTAFVRATRLVTGGSDHQLQCTQTQRTRTAAVTTVARDFHNCRFSAPPLVCTQRRRFCRQLYETKRPTAKCLRRPTSPLVCLFSARLHLFFFASGECRCDVGRRATSSCSTAAARFVIAMRPSPSRRRLATRCVLLRTASGASERPLARPSLCSLSAAVGSRRPAARCRVQDSFWSALHVTAPFFRHSLPQTHKTRVC